MTTSNQTKNRIKILLVDDNPVNLTLLSSILTNYGYQARRMISGEMALKALQEAEFDLIILDIDMPQLNGYMLCQMLKDNPQTANIPVIFISALDEGLDKKKAFQVGGSDYIGKPFQTEEIIARIENQVKILSLKKRLKENNSTLEKQINKRNKQLKSANQELKKVQQQLLDKSLKDSATNVYNKVSFMGQLRKSLRKVKSKPEFCFSLLIFRYYCPQFANQILDSEIEDLIAISVADRLSSNLKKAKIIARLAENEFAVILNHVPTIEQATEIAEKIKDKLLAPLYFQGQKIEIEVYYGLSLGNNNSTQLNQLLKSARNSAYQRETEQINSPFSSHNQPIQNIDPHHAKLVNRFEQALAQNNLIPLYKPIINLAKSQISALEVSVGWAEKNNQNISSSELSSILLQKPELNFPFWQWILKITHKDLREWQELILWDTRLSTLSEDIKLYFQLFEDQILFPDLIQHIAQISTNLAIDSKSLILEIPESSIIKHPDLVHKLTKQIDKIGFSLSIDRLSTEYIVLNSQYQFPVENLKIDSRLTNEHNSSKKLIEKIATLATDMGIAILVKEIEDINTLKSCQQLGLKFGMGNLISPPIPSHGICNLIQEKLFLDHDNLPARQAS